MHDKSNRLSYADARNISLDNATCEVCFKYDADIVFLDEAYEILKNKIAFLLKNDDYCAVTFGYYNLMYCNKYIYTNDKSFEAYLFKKSTCCYRKAEHGDTFTNLYNKKILCTCDRIFLHANNAKPFIHLMYRMRMGEFMKDPQTELSYVEWYALKNNIDISNKNDLINFVIRIIQWILNNNNTCNTFKMHDNTEMNKYFSNVREIQMMDCVIETKDGVQTIRHVNTLILRTKSHEIWTSDEDWINKTYVALSEMYDNGQFKSL
jgi:hypothetical protein